MGPYPSKIDQRDRTRSLKVRHPTESSEKVRYGASLYIKSKSRRRKKFLLQKVSENGIAHIAGLRDEDEIISINQRQLDKNDTVESIVNDIERSDYILLELKRKMTEKKEPIPFIVFFNLTVEACGEVTIHQFGFYWRTPLNEWKEIMAPLIKRVIEGGGRGECIQNLPVIRGREFGQASTPRTSWTLFGTRKRVQISFDDDYLTVAGRRLILEKGGMGTNSHFWQYVYSPSSSLIARNPEVPVIFSPVNMDNFRIVSIGPQVALGHVVRCTGTAVNKSWLSQPGQRVSKSPVSITEDSSLHHNKIYIQCVTYCTVLIDCLYIFCYVMKSVQSIASYTHMFMFILSCI